MIPLSDQIATPALWFPGMDPDEWRFELDRQVNRAMAERDLLEGKISYDEFEEIIEANGVDPIQAFNDWSNGINYVGL
jgi:hypothetical protein